MPLAHDRTDPFTVPAQGSTASTYRGRRRHDPDVEVTEPVVLDPLEPLELAPVAAPPVAVQPVPGVQPRTRAEAKAAARAAEQAARRGRRPAPPSTTRATTAALPVARSGRPAGSLRSTGPLRAVATPRPAGDNVRRAPRRSTQAGGSAGLPAQPPQPRHTRRGLAVVAAVGAVAALAGGAVAAGALPGDAGTEASAALGPRAAAAVGAVDPRGRSVTSEQSSASVLGDDTDKAFRMVAVSRSQERGPIAGCSGKAPREIYANGQLPTSVLCLVPFAAPHRLRADAAVRLIRLNQVYRGQFGVGLCLTDSYRSLGSQYSVAARKPGLAARPGTSEHGWGLAVDVCQGPDQPGSARRAWFLKNAPAFGWTNPAWAQPGGSKPEPWHWEFVEGE